MLRDDRGEGLIEQGRRRRDGTPLAIIAVEQQTAVGAVGSRRHALPDDFADELQGLASGYPHVFLATVSWHTILCH